ncbi:MAG: hypothetical protein VZR33_08970 [Methanosphaera sp.]|uniref:hypothetical protein n=1 Tax=Methanosphaera sp. TaxID=2666342 RepID=UPI002E768BA4|nr:hypothetical protein [Methanosphaera sp.]MEE1117545.1 hypothetical protein [Methanosphaera sp.]MEE3325451.1 hypothetical protein [Methanosphaera sp.]
MSKEKLQNQIINDLKNDFPNIIVEKEENSIVIKADDDTLWEIFDILYKGLDDVEFNMDKDEENHIIIKI